MPYLISENVQSIALEANIGEQAGIDFDQPALEYLARYIDTLTAADIIAKERANRIDKSSPENQDYKIGFSILCFVVPPLKHEPVEIWREIRNDKLMGLYIFETKRDQFRDSLGKAIKMTMEEIQSIFAKSISDDTYRRLFIDYERL